MCLAKAFVNNWSEQPVLQDVAHMRVNGDRVELENLFGSPEKPRGASQRHSERVEWLSEHIEDVLPWLGLSNDRAANWSIEPLFVVDQELLSPYIADSSLEILSVRELKEKLYSSSARDSG